MVAEIEKNIRSRKDTDKLMWFSIWVLLSVASFGLAWFLMIYFLIKRRNTHFSRQKELETLILTRLNRINKQKNLNHDSSFDTKNDEKVIFRNTWTWALSTILIFPAFYIIYFLIVDLQRHEENEFGFLVKVNSMLKNLDLEINLDEITVRKKFELNRYLFFSIMTIGFAAIYWLYRIFNDYNIHFKRQWKLEDELLKFLTSLNCSEAN
jgi:hypothetical protein